MPRIHRLVVMILVLFNVTVLSASANTNSQQWVVTELRKLYADQSTLKVIAEMFQMPPEKEAVMIGYIGEIYTNEKFLQMMAKEIILQGVISDNEQDPETLFQRGVSFGYEFTTQLSVNGLKRLPDERVLSYIKFTRSFFDLIEPRHCRALMGASTRQQDEIEAGIVALRNMTLSEMKSYFTLNREAVTAELNDWPVPVSLNDYQQETGNRVFEDSFAMALSNTSEAQNIILALTSPENADDVDFCTAGKFVMQIMIDLEGMSGNWFRRSFVLSL